MENLKEKLLELLSACSAIKESMEISIRGDLDNVWKYAGYKGYIRKYNQLVKETIRVTGENSLLDIYDESKIKSNLSTIALQQKGLFESVHANLSVLKAYLENKAGTKENKVIQIRDFLEANLRRAMFKEPQKEAEVQDVIEQLLIGRGMEKGVDYDREVGRVKVSIKEVIPDFIFNKLGLALEVKLSKNTTKSKAIVDEINADIMSYSRDYRSTLFVIYDLGSIRDETEFKSDLEVKEGISVIVVKH